MTFTTVLYFFLNLLFAIAGNIILPATVGGWIFGVLWVNAPFKHNIPGLLWIITALCPLILLGLLKPVKKGWGKKLICLIWDKDSTQK